MQNSIKFTLYIGSNNKTKELDTDTIKRVLQHFKIHAYTYQEALGYWNNSPEKNALVTILTEEASPTALSIPYLAGELARILEQDAVLVESTASNMFTSNLYAPSLTL